MTLVRTEAPHHSSCHVRTHADRVRRGKEVCECGCSCPHAPPYYRVDVEPAELPPPEA